MLVNRIGYRLPRILTDLATGGLPGGLLGSGHGERSSGIRTGDFGKEDRRSDLERELENNRQARQVERFRV